MKSAEIETRIRALAAEKRLPAAHLERWLAMDHPSRARLLEIIETLKLRTGQIVTAIDTLHEIAVREQVTIAEILERAEIRRTLKSPGSTPARASALIDQLRAMRFPRLRAIRLTSLITDPPEPPPAAVQDELVAILLDLGGRQACCGSRPRVSSPASRACSRCPR